MNARTGHFVKPYRGLGVNLLVSAAACGLLSACVGNPFEDAKVNPSSPIAAEVTKSVKLDAAYPTFASVPAAPKDIRPRKQYGLAAAEEERASAQLTAQTADSAWTLSGTEAFAAEARRAVGPDLAAPQPADTEAFAAALRKRATPPPPAKH
jgi:hypothetical protein